MLKNILKLYLLYVLLVVFFRPRIDERIKSCFKSALLPIENPLFSKDNNFNKRTKVLILGSGGLSIGQAGEFDYSGSQVKKITY